MATPGEIPARDRVPTIVKEMEEALALAESRRDDPNFDADWIAVECVELAALIDAYKVLANPLDARLPDELAYLRSDVRLLTCLVCGRKSTGEVGDECKMPQPDGRICEGVFGY